MPPLSEAEAKEILARVLKFSKADFCEANLTAQTGGNIRYARNTVSTAGYTEDRSLVVQSIFGKKSGTTTVNEFDDAALEKAVRKSEELAKLAPDDPEMMDPLGPQTYLPVNAYVDATANITPTQRAQAAAASIAPAKAKDCAAAGFLQDGASYLAMANTKGLFAYHRETGGNFTVTVRSNDGRGSGYASRTFDDVGKLDTATASTIALEKAIASREAKAIEPGKYTVILEPLATVDLVGFMFFNMDARSADEGRSFMSKAGGGTKVGEKLFDERVSIYSDPQNADVPGRPWTGDGRPQQRVDWVKNGVANQLFYSRYWAEKMGKPAVAFPPNVIMPGGTATTEELIRDTSRGVLVTRTWYIRMVDPQTVLLTGLTRDGTFYIEDGKIKHAVKNFRFNESPVIMLNNIDAIGKPERVGGGEGGPVSLIPPLRVRDFTFSSLSDAV